MGEIIHNLCSNIVQIGRDSFTSSILFDVLASHASALAMSNVMIQLVSTNESFASRVSLYPEDLIGLMDSGGHTWVGKSIQKQNRAGANVPFCNGGW